MITTVKLISISITVHNYLSFFFGDENTQDLLISNIQYSIINCSHHVVDQVSRTYSSYSSKFDSFDQHLP